MVAMYIEDVLADLGCEVVGVATSLDRAVELAREWEADFAILDIKPRRGRELPGCRRPARAENTVPVCERLLLRGHCRRVP